MNRFPGSKGAEGVWQRIISEMPPHRVYVEPFYGSGVVERRKRPADITVCVDSDREIARAGNAGNGDAAGRTFICGDGIRWLKDFRADRFSAVPYVYDALVYCDPPYLMSTRSCQRRYYRHELDAAGHGELLYVLKKLKCCVMLSGYRSAMYDAELAGWRRVDIPTVARNGQPRIECLWCNFPEPLELHDYRFLGHNYRERERIKKKKSRWVTRLRTMPSLERHAILSAISEFASTWRNLSQPLT